MPEHDPTGSLALRDSWVGVPSFPKGRPIPTVLEFLSVRFPRVARDEWRRRLAEGRVWDESGRTLTADEPCPSGGRLRYRREVLEEPQIPFEEAILEEDEEILVADKPPFLPVTPSGRWVNECLLYRLIRRTGCAALQPIHRLDRETAGVVLLVKTVPARRLYGKWMAAGLFEKRYEAVARWRGDPVATEWTVESRIVRGHPWFRVASDPAGPPNARTRIRLLETSGRWGYYEIVPETGKQHQIRLHMAESGAPIRHDPFYPVLQPAPKSSWERPLQLLARVLSWRDPRTGQKRVFESRFRLEWPVREPDGNDALK